MWEEILPGKEDRIKDAEKSQAVPAYTTSPGEFFFLFPDATAG